MRHLIRTCTKRVPDAELQRIEIPTELIWGRHDRMVPLRVGRPQARSTAGRFHVIEDAGHVPHIEQPDAFLAALRPALETLTGEEGSMSTSTIDIAGLEGGRVNLTSEQLEDLESRHRGLALRAGDEGWDEAVLMWNGMVADVPRSSSSRPRRRRRRRSRVRA